MYKKIVFLSFIIPLWFVSTYGQSYHTVIKTGYGFYEMHNVKRFQSILSESDWRFQLKPVDSFPAYLNFQVQFAKEIGADFFTGIAGGFYSTGGRMALSDYSGLINVDQKLKAYTFGIFIEKSIYNFIYFSFELSGMYSRMELSEKIIISNRDISSSESFDSYGIAAEPGLFFQFGLSPVILRAGTGFLINYTSDFKSIKNSDVVLSSINPEWNGIRVYISAGYEF